MNLLKTVWTWLIYSSANPSAFSLSVKSFLTLLVTYGTMAAGLAHISLPSDLLTQLVDAIVSAVQSILMLVSAIGLINGLFRKIKSTIDGTNEVLNGMVQ